MPVAQTRPSPRLARPRPERFPSRYREPQASPSFRVRRRDCTYAVQGLLASKLAAFLLEPLRFDLFGLLEKILGGLRSSGSAISG